MVSTALQMENDSFAHLDWEEGVCFIYRYNVEPGAYAEKINEDFFGDFYDNASYYFYEKSISALLSGVNVKDEASSLDFTSVEFNYELYVRV